MSDAGKAIDRAMLTSRLASSGQWDRLLEASREWLAQEPENPVAHRYCAQSLIKLGRHGEAEVHLEKLLVLRPNDSVAHRMMSMVQFELKRYGKADEWIQRAIAINPMDPNHWYHLARMCYVQKDLASGLKWISKARELAPNDPDILNLYALCSGDAESRAVMLREVLALDPENAYAHNNLGTYYLGTAKDYPKAEECFRRALFLAPGLKIARSNLFVAIKQRDLIYRILCAPRDFLFRMRQSLFGGEGRHPGAVGVGVLVWLVLFRFVAAALLLWFIFIWPMLKVYEFLIIGDIRRQAGELGARRGGFLGYRQWPLQLRLAVFGVLLIGFWVGVYLVFGRAVTQSSETGDTVSGLVFAAVLIGLLIYFGGKLLKKAAVRFHTWRRSRRLRHLSTTQE